MSMTVELDPDVADALNRIHEAQHVDVKVLVNDVLRSGLKDTDVGARPEKKEPFRTKVVDLGKPLLPNVDNIHEVLVYAEGEDYR